MDSLSAETIFRTIKKNLKVEIICHIWNFFQELDIRSLPRNQQDPEKLLWAVESSIS